MTPTEFRTSYDEWSRSAPANDSDILTDKRIAEHPRHAGMCDDLKSMRAWREMKESHDALQTNFIQPGRDDEIFEDGFPTVREYDVESEWECRPTIGEIMRAIQGVKFTVRFDRIQSTGTDGRLTYLKREKVIPDLMAAENEGLIEFGEEYESKLFSGLMRPIVRIGKLRFSQADGSDTRPRASLTRIGWVAPQEEPGDEKGGSESFHRPPDRQLLDPLERLIAMERAVAANDNMQPAHRKVLDIAITARNFGEVGQAFGYSGKNAERRGKRLVQEAAKELSLILERCAA
ncbi:hypothetical protein [Bradyrhizobium sp. Bra64]|uniref:hypothetical protein n=1 Tax=Bradyrhizobium sp. Bra64 TaxID=2926009 RepID=UPI00211956B3|nr:hypothetical protein [Bradyrhizobium sp. Bra64]